jgi:TolB-like protein/tetratricopeptide (TPR) repeat protein
MSNEPAAGPAESAEATAAPTVHGGSWERIKNHKVLQWGVAYLGASLALAQAQDLLAASFGWSALVGRVVLILLIAGLPIALTIAWYHGHRALRHMSAGELGILSVLVLIGGVFFSAAFRPAGEAASPPSAEPPAVTSAPTNIGGPPFAAADVLPNKIAVLPCENLSPDANDAHFATGLHQDIIWQLDKLKELNPLPRRVVLPYADTRLTLAEIARELDVEALLDCAVRYANGRVRITAELLDAGAARTLWQDDYEPSIADLGDVFAVQADIAMNIANALSVVFTTEERLLLEKPPTVSTEAYVFLLRAYDAPNVEKEEELLRQAIAADPGYALPYAILAARWSSTLINTNLAAAIPAAERAALGARVRTYALRALELEPSVPSARAALTMDAMLNWRWSEAYALFAGARSMAPNDVMQYDIFLLSYLGRFEEAMAVANRARQLFPNRPAEQMWKGWALGYRGRYDDAAREFAAVVESAPGAAFVLARDWLARMEVARGNDAAALEQLRLSERIATERQPVFLPMWAYCYGRLGEGADARRIFAEMETKEAAGTRFGAGGWAMAHLAVGDESRALEQLRVAARKAAEHEPDEGFFALMALRTNVTNDDRLRHPEFVEVLERIRGD